MTWRFLGLFCKKRWESARSGKLRLRLEARDLSSGHLTLKCGKIVLEEHDYVVA
jgi:hypothetical protein